MAEVFAAARRGGVDATILDEYQGGIITDTPEYEINHIVSIVGWGETRTVSSIGSRNSRGHYWGEMGFFRIVRGVKAIGIEDECSATPARGRTTTSRASRMDPTAPNPRRHGSQRRRRPRQRRRGVQSRRFDDDEATRKCAIDAID